uniref:Serine/threonine-protein phosphatase 6 regulatory subunit 3 n=1 Tax=Mesocestoides corti TaxID=53468 RepID=A0A5K3FFM3_MESCO
RLRCSAGCISKHKRYKIVNYVNCLAHSCSLLSEDRISRLIELVTDQSNITFDAVRFKRPSVAAELLSSDVPPLLDFIISPGEKPEKTDASATASTDVDNCVGSSDPPFSMPCVDRLLDFIDTAQPLNSLSASFFSKIMTNLLYFRANEVVPYLQKRTDFLPNLLRHIGTSAICDLLIDLAQQDNGQQHTVAQWFLDCNIIAQLLSALSPSSPLERQEYSARCLVELMSVYRNYVAVNAPEPPAGHKVGDGAEVVESPDTSNAFDSEKERVMFERALAVLDEFESEHFLGDVLDLIVDDASSSPSLRSFAIDVFLACIDKGKSSNGLPPGAGDDFKENPIGNLAAGLFNVQVPGMSGFMNRLATKANCPLLMARLRRVESTAAAMVIPRLPKLYSLLQSSECTRSSGQHYLAMPTTVGTLSPPLGKSRLAIVELVSVLCQLEYASLREAICQTRFLPCFMHLFESYPFNTLLHMAVTSMFRHLFSSPQVTASEGTKGDNASTLTSPTENANGCSSLDKTPEEANKQGSEEVPRERNIFVQHLLEDCHVIDWILRLSCIPNDKSNTTGEDSSAKCRLSSIRPKPGYSGHLWQIANIVSASVLSKDLPPDVASKWDSFVQNDLEAINEAQRITEDEAVAENTDDRSPFALGSLRIGGAGCQMAELFKILHGGADFQFITSGFRNGALGQGDGEEGAPRSDPNEDAFDDDDDVDGAEECEDHQAVEPNVSSDDEGAGGGGGGSDSSDEEILQSPLTIRQQRTNQAPATLHLPVNGIPFVKQMDASSPSWPPIFTPVDTPMIHSTADPEGERGSKVDNNEGWADFESASFERS